MLKRWFQGDVNDFLLSVRRQAGSYLVVHAACAPSALDSHGQMQVEYLLVNGANLPCHKIRPIDWRKPGLMLHLLQQECSDYKRKLISS
ncbi:hypothetical protein OUZ56_014730 [Daphnia magna]|uniref:Uncharacterized protein n=1 Tax=Daphnia magna TaxID=35525 RepID=A0ABR0AKM9_9CRUS|nr:hypothetical protein OUZ56_014730 [Daphnia magna]